MKAASYQRVSQDQAGGRSVAEQEAENRSVIERYGWELVTSITDNDISASRYSRKARPGWDRLMSLLRGGDIEVLVAWEASRSTRDLKAYIQLREVCREHGVKLCYNGKLFDLSRSDDSFMTGLDILLAEKEADQTRERIMRSVRANLQSGRPHGKRPYGYQRVYNQGTGQLESQEIREDQARVIREAAKRVLAGEATNAIAKDFNARGIPSPAGAKWSLMQIKRTLCNPTYIGKRTHKGEIIGDGQWPAILDEATFYQIVAKLKDPKRMNRKDGAVKHLLTGIAVCGVCGGKVGMLKNRGRYYSYQCKTKFCVARTKFPLEKLISELIIARLSQPDASMLFRGERPQSKDVLHRIAETRARLDTFYDAAAAGELTAQALARIETKLLAEIEALEGTLRRNNLPSTVLELVRDPAQVWEQLTISQKREVISCLLEVRINPTTRHRTFDPNSVDVVWREDVA